MLLVWFMRTMAVVWISKGLFAWTIALGVDRNLADFLELPVVTQGMIGFFAVTDLMAAVGLWLAAPWGGVALADLRSERGHGGDAGGPALR